MRLEIGVRRTPAGALQSHAWVRDGHRVIVGGPVEHRLRPDRGVGQRGMTSPAAWYSYSVYGVRILSDMPFELAAADIDTTADGLCVDHIRFRNRRRLRARG